MIQSNTVRFEKGGEHFDLDDINGGSFSLTEFQAGFFLTIGP